MQKFVFRGDVRLADSERSVRAVVNVGLHLGNVVDPLAEISQLGRFKVNLEDFLGPLEFQNLCYCNTIITHAIHAHLLKHDSDVQVRPGESLPHHPLATIFIKELLHVLDEVVELALEFLPVFLSGIFGIEEWMN